ncbi:MAG: HAD family phosphatase [Pseudomonadota bacterium]
MEKRRFFIKAVLFDFDGTLTKPGALDFLKIKRAIGCPPDMPLLEFISGLGNPKDREAARVALDGFEMEAAANSQPNEGADEMVRFLKESGLLIGIISRNSLKSIHRAFGNFKEIHPSDFDLIVSRDAPVAPKPSPDAVSFAAGHFKVDTEEVLVVGDFVFDIISGRDAGAWTVLLKNRTTPQTEVPESDFTITRLMELKDIVRPGRPQGAWEL